MARVSALTSIFCLKYTHGHCWHILRWNLSGDVAVRNSDRRERNCPVLLRIAAIDTEVINLSANDDHPEAPAVKAGEPFIRPPSSAVSTELSTPQVNEIGIPTQLAGPWSRYWARGFDFMLWLFLVSLPIGWYVPAAFSGAKILIAYLVILALSVILDALIYSVCGNTPGKWVAGIRVLDESGNKVAFERYLKRNVQVYIRGIGLGIAIVSLFTLYSAYQQLVAQETLSWDEKFETRVFQLRTGWWRSYLAACLYIGMVAITIYLRGVTSSPEGLIRVGAAAANIGTPKMIDETTRLDSAEPGPGRAIQYNYTILSDAADDINQEFKEGFETAMRKPLKDQICSSDDVKPLRDIGTTFRYRYSNRYGGLIALISIPSSECTAK
jgi:uncharacterized RDD family membrane protein YckC